MTQYDFNRIPELKKAIRKALDAWENAIASATSMSAVLTGMPKGNNVTSRVENAIVKAETAKETYDELCEELRDIYLRMEEESQLLSEDEADVLRKYYKESKKIAEIATAKGLSERQIYRLKKSAINALCPKIFS